MHSATSIRTPGRPAMRIASDDPGPLRRELDQCAELVPLAGADVLELGCGRAEFTRAAAERFPDARFVAFEVDAVQHASNVASAHPANVRFALGGAQAIPAADASVDAVLMLKSLHHVPVALMDAALDEIARVLRPGGRAYVTEPVYAGDFNALMALFHDERDVRIAAFAALRRAAERGALHLAGEHFWRARRRYESFDDFARQMIGVTHTEHRLAPRTLAAVRDRYARHADANGAAAFDQQMRTDVLLRA